MYMPPFAPHWRSSMNEYMNKLIHDFMYKNVAKYSWHILNIVKKQEDAFLVPIIYSFGYFVGGFISLYLIVFKMKIKLVCPNLKSSILYIKDSSSIFATDIICAIKDKLSYEVRMQHC